MVSAPQLLCASADKRRFTLQAAAPDSPGGRSGSRAAGL